MLAGGRELKAIFFDAGGTLFRPYPSVGAIYSKMALKHGLHTDPQKIEHLFAQAWHSRNGLSSLAGATSDKIERDWWYALVKDVFASLGSFSDFEAFFAELYDLFARAECWRLFDDSLATLEKLKLEGFRLGMISNWDHRLFSIVKDLGIEPYFEKILASSTVGVAKPAAAIFHQALEALGVRAEEALHIGDSFVDDFQGATAAGMTAVLLNRSGKDYNGLTVISGLNQLVSLLHKSSPADATAALGSAKDSVAEGRKGRGEEFFK